MYCPWTVHDYNEHLTVSAVAMACIVKVTEKDLFAALELEWTFGPGFNSDLTGVVLITILT